VILSATRTLIVFITRNAMSQNKIEEQETDDSSESSGPEPFSKSWWTRCAKATWISGKDFFRDDGPYWAGSIAYYTLLSAIPVALLLALAASIVVDSSEAVDRISGVAGDLLPEGEEQVKEIVEASYDGRGVAGFFSVILLLWSGAHVFGAISRALNVAYNVPTQRGLWMQLGTRFAMMLSVASLLVLGLLSRALLDELWSIQGIDEDDRTMVFSILRNVLPFLFTSLAFFLVYRFVPIKQPGWKAALTGAVLASGAFYIAREAFVYYQANFGGFDEVYGPIALLVALLVWIWIAGVILLLGGQLVAHYQEILVEGEDPDDVEDRHRQAKENRDRPGPDDDEDGDE
jgi:membrane protein